ncbi:hypothetical protein [Sphingorhabdus sp.]|jgi:hypothetical protein
MKRDYLARNRASGESLVIKPDWQNHSQAMESVVRRSKFTPFVSA